MFDFKNYTLPTTPEEVEANRKQFVDALLAETPEGQCRGSLYESPFTFTQEMTMTNAEILAAKHKRCAVGLAGEIFFGIRNEADLERWSCNGGADDLDIYDEVGKMLGIDAKEESPVVTIVHIWTANDDEEATFAQIGEELAVKWNLK